MGVINHVHEYRVSGTRRSNGTDWKGAWTEGKADKKRLRDIKTIYDRLNCNLKVEERTTRVEIVYQNTKVITDA